MTPSTRFRRGAVALCLSALAGASALAQADKSIAVEHVPAAPAFNLWISTAIPAMPEPAVTAPRNLPLVLFGQALQQAWQPAPVILGLPELPLVGAGAADTSKGWSSSFNYQGLVMRQVVLDAAGRQRQLRPMSSPVRPGERFRLRLTATYEAVAELGLIRGEPWASVRAGQAYPKPGYSVGMKAGETVELPLQADEYFVMGNDPAERLLVSVRHPRASESARSGQPAYRQDGAMSSTYLQLVPRNTYPAIEQLISLGR